MIKTELCIISGISPSPMGSNIHRVETSSKSVGTCYRALRLDHLWGTGVDEGYSKLIESQHHPGWVTGVLRYSGNLKRPKGSDFESRLLLGEKLQAGGRVTTIFSQLV